MKKTKTKDILKSIFDYWYSSHSIKPKQLKGKIPWGKLTDVTPKKAGEYYDSGKTGLKLELVEIPEMNGKSFREVGEYLQKKYGDRLPGLEVMEAVRNGETNLKKTDVYQWWYFFGSVFRYQGGSWRVPYLGAVDLSRRGSWLGGGWGDGDRVVLLENNLDTDPLPPLDLESLAFALRKIKEGVEEVISIIEKGK